MKRRTEKPTDRGMRFFTPELYVRFNSTDDDEADAANEAWETAINAYRGHLKELRDWMPSQVRRLAELSLHDAELLAHDQVIEPVLGFPFEPPGPFWAFPGWSALAIVSVKHDGRVLSLIYLLWDRLRTHEPVDDWPFSKLRVHWLYDEIDIAPGRRGMFLHRVLLSDGRVLEIPFVSVVIHDLLAPSVSGEARSGPSG